MQYRRKSRRNERIFSILIILILLASTFSPVIGGRFGEGHSKGLKKVKTTSLDKLKEKIYNFLNNTLIKRFPRLSRLPFIQHLLRILCPDKPNQNDGDNINDVEEETNEEPTEEVFPIDENNIQYLSEGEQNENLTQLAKKKDSINLTESLQMIPSNGRIRFVGEGDANFSFTFDFNGTIVTLNGRIHIGPGIGEVDICWNISQGYFEIHGNGSFVLSGTYICIEDWLTFRIGTLAGDTGGEEIGLTLMERGAAGDIHLNGLFTIQNISLQISSKKLALSLSLNGTHEADNITISWGENGLHISGSHSGSTVLEMPKFSLRTSLFSISAANMVLMTNSEIQFVEEENRVLCAIHGELYIGLIGVMYGGYTTSVRDITVKGDLNLEMHISSNSVDVDERHITITGSFYVNIDTTFSINGVEVDIKGEFFFETEGGRIDIWVYENSGMVCINATSKSTIEGFYLGVNEKHLQISADEIYFFAGKGYIETSSSSLRLAGGIEVRNFMVDTKDIHFKTSSMYLGGYIDISSGEEKIVSFSTQAGFSALGLELTIQDYILKADGLSIYAQASGWGEFISTFHAKNLSFNFSGYFAAFNISAGSLDSAPFIGAAYVGVVGDAWVELREGLVEFRVNAGGYLIVGGSPLGPVSIMITGWVHGILDLEKKEMWGEFGANAVIAMPNINLGSTDGSSQIHAALMVTISGEGEFHMTSTYLEANISGSFSFGGRFGFQFAIGGMNIAGGGGFSGGGTYDAYIYINFSTGEVYAGGSGGGIGVVWIEWIKVWGEDVNLPDVPPEGYTAGEKVPEWSLHIDSIDIYAEGLVTALVAFSFDFSVSYS
ncbi:MAG: hypothetical protein DRN25_06545, partial [Thermoplasmata archaeon]